MKINSFTTAESLVMLIKDHFYVIIKTSPLRIYTRQNFVACSNYCIQLKVIKGHFFKNIL